MLKTIYRKGLIIEPSTTQKHILKLYTNMQLMLLILLQSKVPNIKKTVYNYIYDVVNTKRATIYTNDNINVNKINKLVNFNASNHFTKKLEHTSNKINKITRQTIRIMSIMQLSKLIHI